MKRCNKHEASIKYAIKHWRNTTKVRRTNTIIASNITSKKNAEVIFVDREVIKEAAKLKIKVKPPTIDSLVYAAVKKVGAKVVSGCPHFRKISDAYLI